MSELAEQQRRVRRTWAATGSSHDRVIATARIGLPAALGVLAAFLAFAPLTVGRDISFVLSKDRVDVARERMRVAEASYRGQDAKGQPFQLNAASAVQQTSRDPIVRLQKLDATIRVTDGPASLRAERGRYDMDSERMAIDGPVIFDGSGGYHIETRDVLLDLKQRAMASRGAVDGKMPLGTFAADRMRADLDKRTVLLAGRARLHIVQAGGTARR